MLIVFAAVWLVDRGRHAYAVTFLGAAMFFAAALVWAPRAARRSVTAEVAARTWDFQRLSALSPWAMTWGRLAGATLRPWAAAAAGLAVTTLQLASTSTSSHALFWLLVAVGLAVTVQAAGLASGLLDVRRARASGRPLSGRAPGLLVLALALLTFAALFWARVRIGHAAHALFGRATSLEAPVSWYGLAAPPVGFAAFSLALCAAWALVWAWRLMRVELQLSNAPWAWSLFVVGAALYAAGFDPAPSPDAGEAMAARVTSAGFTLAALAYAGAFADPADRVRARQFAQAVRRRDLGRAGLRLPLVMLPSLLCLATGLYVAWLHARADAPQAALLTLAMLAFFVRDLGVIAWRRFAPGAQPGDLGVAATLIALYVMGAACGRLFAGSAGEAAFLPSTALPLLSALMGVIEAAMIWTLAAVRIASPSRGPLRPTRVQAAPPATTAAPPA